VLTQTLEQQSLNNYFRASDRPHILDLIISDENFVVYLDYMGPLGKSVDAVLVFDCELSIISCDNTYKFNFNRSNCDQLKLFLDRDWMKEFDCLGDNVEDVLNYFKSKLEC